MFRFIPFICFILLSISLTSDIYAQFRKPNAFNPDSTLSDSSRDFTHIKRRVIYMNPGSLRGADFSAQDSLRLIPAHTRFWDEADTLDGFIQTLGNTGKPVRQFQYGLSAHLFNPGRNTDIFSNQSDPYWIFDPASLKYFDTRTPYVNVNFAQASKKLQLLDVTVSQNITPWWNAVVYYKRRTSQGNFFNSALDHYNMYTTHSFRSRNQKLFVQAAAIFQELKDGINGGIGYFKAFDVFEINPLNTSTEIYNSLLRRNGKQVYGHAVYKFYRDSSDTFFKLNIFAEGDIASQFRRYEDLAFSRNPEKYVHILRDSSQMNEFWEIHSRKIKAGTGIFTGKIYHEFSASLQRMDVQQFPGIQYAHRNIFFIQEYNYLGKYTTGTQGLHLEWNAHRRQLEFFPQAIRAEIQGKIPLPFYQNISRRDSLRRFAFPDRGDSLKVWKPLNIIFAAKSGNVQPALMDTLYRGNTFSGINMYRNQQVFHIRGGLEYTRADIIKNEKYRLSGNYYKIQGFYSSVQNPVIYTSDLQIQNSENMNYSRAGIDAGFRMRFSRFYVEPQFVIQARMSSDISLENYIYDQPAAWMKTGLFYENQLFRNAGVFRFGIDLYWFSDYYGFNFDPGSGIFYPGRLAVQDAQTGESLSIPQLIPSYLRADVYLNAKVKDAVIFIKMLHVNQGMQYLQYYTTPYYPMWGRTFSFGVNWTFFD